MPKLIIYGASDDLIEIESDVFGAEEFNVYLDDAEESLLLGISDGTVLRVRYDYDGIWRFSPIKTGSSEIFFELGVDDDKHSDRVTLTGDNLTWVMVGSHIAK